MRYLFTDYLLLSAAYSQKSDIEGLLRYMCDYLTCLPCYDSFRSSLSKLCGGGFMQGLEITGKGKKFFEGKKKFLESKRRMLSRLEDEFTDGTNECTPSEVNINKEEFDAAIKKIYDEYNSDAFISYKDGVLTIGRKGINTQEDAEDMAEDEVCAEETMGFSIASGEEKYLVCALIDSAYDALFSHSKSKICLYGEKDAYILSLMQDGEDIKISAAKILYNKKSFKQKSGGSLDYAQCGDTALTFRCTPYELSHNICCTCAYLECFEDFPYDKLAKIRGEIR